MARGDKPVIHKEKATPPEHGNLSGDELSDAVLMEHPGKGRRYIPKDEVKRKVEVGYVVVEGADPGVVESCSHATPEKDKKIRKHLGKVAK